MSRDLRELYGLPNLFTPDVVRPLRGYYPERLISLQEKLDNAGQKAFRSPTFVSRSAVMVAAVSDIVSSGIVSELGLHKRINSGRKRSIEDALKDTLQKVEDKFESYFGSDGTFIETEEHRVGFDRDRVPMRASGQIAYISLPTILEACGIEGWDKARIDQLLQRVTFQDAAEITAQELDLPRNIIRTVAKSSRDDLRERLHSVIPASKTEEQNIVDTLPMQQISSLSKDDQLVLKIAVRVVQATWLVHQSDRAKRDKVDNRVHPDYTATLEASPDRGVFRIYDLMLRQNFDEHKTINGGMSWEDTLLGTTFVETWKDIAQLKKYSQVDNRDNKTEVLSGEYDIMRHMRPIDRFYRTFFPVQAVERMAKHGKISQAEAIAQAIAHEAPFRRQPFLRRYTPENQERMHDAVEFAKDRAAYERREIQKLAAQLISDTFQQPLNSIVIDRMAAYRGGLNATELQTYIQDELATAQLVKNVNEAVRTALSGRFALHGGDAGSFSGGTDVRGVRATPDIDLLYTGLPKGKEGVMDWTKIDINNDSNIPFISHDGQPTKKRGVQTLEEVKHGIPGSSFYGDETLGTFIETTMENMRKQGLDPQFKWLRSAANNPIVAFNMVINHPVYGELPIDINVYHAQEAFGLTHRERFNEYIDNIARTRGVEGAGRVIRTIQELKRMFKLAVEELPESEQGSAKVAGFLVEGLITHGKTPSTIEDVLRAIVFHDPNKRTAKPYMTEQYAQVVDSEEGNTPQWIDSLMDSPALPDAAYTLMRQVAAQFMGQQ
ncbi:MAG TPA: hypothetical protein VN711_00660 [Candidatus Saccharimonadales bacterium]|nr:hypothetical protein [Candidatus Saccharimonadales bacterium]